MHIIYKLLYIQIHGCLNFEETNTINVKKYVLL